MVLSPLVLFSANVLSPYPSPCDGRGPCGPAGLGDWRVRPIRRITTIHANSL